MTVALYLRISKDDFNKNKKESNSILNQRLLLKSFVQNHPQLSHSTMLEIVDDGYSGVHFQRPGIITLLDMAKKRMIDCIVVKDFSRFGRNYLEVGNYLEQVFPKLGIRFFSVNDQFDSFYGLGAAGSIEVGFKNIIYEAYSKDLSTKVKTARKTKAQQGKFITAFAPFGYLKGTKNNLVLDPECAPIVQRIFRLFCSGMGQTEIAKQFNKEGILCPRNIRKKRGERLGKFKNEVSVWRAGTICHILSDQRYTGDAIFGKTISKKECIVVSNIHPAIITRDEFEIAQTKKKQYKDRAKQTIKQIDLEKEHKELQKNIKQKIRKREIYEKYRRGELNRKEFQIAINKI